MKRFSGILFLLLCVPSLFAQSLSISDMIGKPFPDFKFNTLINSSSSEITLKDLKGKYLLLDFWGTFCAPCIANMPKTSTLQEKFKGQLNIILVGIDGKEKIQNLYNRMETVGKPITLPIAVDTTLSKKFNIKTVPHYIWIDDQGVLRAVTNDSYVTEENLRLFVSGNRVNFPIKEDDSQYLVTDDSKPLFINGNYSGDLNVKFQSVLTGYQEGIWAGGYYPPNGKGTHVGVYNRHIMSLYTTAYGDENRPFPYHRVRFETPDSALYKMTGDYSMEKYKAAVCYELIVSEEKSKDILKIMQKDLKKFYDLEVVIEYAPELCYVLVKNNDVNLLASDEKSSAKASLTGVQLKNMPLSKLLYYLWFFNQRKTFLNETGIAENVDVRLDAYMKDIDDVNNKLRQYGLELKREYRSTKQMVLKDRNPQIN
ncbi:TlpA family protein disulfide reductase [Parapedobacter sp. 10938]|uniref:TlpA family protein disulfide reductase n=1 Tax=Parapedobacter flavus TaxID=3110225 RepID=UPI002DBFDA4B|nr:TlpA disulfide reductase family protein [Parapedobacter sp. 10938]MEC3880212.1 TlpA disulfide reductase family protein [Parapedobacter sp. 10938]